MSNVSHIHVRSLEIADFDFVRDLASQQPNFTVPPMYVLWLILRIKGAICLVAEHSGRGPMAYMLAVPVEGPEQTVFVWQLASTKSGQKAKATLALLTEFRTILARRSVRTIAFSSVPNSPNYRAIRQYAWKVFSLPPERTGLLPFSVSSSESEFLLNLNV